MTDFELTSPEAREHDRVPEWDDDPTPRGVVGAVLKAALALDVLRRRVCFAGARVLDLGAGFGCWSSEIRKLAAEKGWPVHITAVEINPERDADLSKWCDDSWCGHWREFLACGVPPNASAPPQHFDIITGNPPFAHVLRQGRHEDPNKRTDYKPVPETMVPTLLEHAPAVLLLHTGEAFTKSEHGRDVWRAYPPAATWLVGPLGFRGPGHGMAPTCYQATLWLRGHTGPCSAYMLPRLTTKGRKWTTPPGSESPEWARANGYPLAPGYEGES